MRLVVTIFTSHYTNKYVESFHTWISNHPQVVNYPTSNELITINQEDISLIKEPKLMFQNPHKGTSERSLES